MSSALRLSLQKYAALFLAWTALGAFMFSQTLTQRLFSKDPTPWWHHLESWMIGVYIWFLLTPAVLWLGRRFPLERKHWLRRAALHSFLSIAAALFQLGLESAVLRGLGLFPSIMTSYAVTFVFLLIIGFHQSVLTYWTVLGIQYGFGWYRRYQERRQEALRLELHSSRLERQLAQAQLSAMKSQLQPHFLFNTLNAIMVLVRQQNGREAEEMLARLSDLLRSVLDDVHAQEVPLSRELEYLQLYLSIEQVRFQDRLRVEIASDPAVLDASVPHLVLQPLVENAIRHGIGKSSSAGKIRISACGLEDKLEIKVEDDGPGLGPVNPARAPGIGLANTRARLNQLYGDAARLSVENGAPGGVVAAILLPCRIGDPMESHVLHGTAR
jgi:two-component system, LytTR family, sensor kinase